MNVLGPLAFYLLGGTTNPVHWHPYGLVAHLGVNRFRLVFAKPSGVTVCECILGPISGSGWRKSNRWSSLGATGGGAALAPGIFLWLFVRMESCKKTLGILFGGIWLCTAHPRSLTQKFWDGEGNGSWYLSNMQWYVLGLPPCGLRLGCMWYFSHQVAIGQRSPAEVVALHQDDCSDSTGGRRT